MASNWYKSFMAASGVIVGSRKPEATQPGPPMDLQNMRDNGVRSLAVFCLDCHHRATVNVDDYPGHLAVKSFEARMACKCGGRRVDSGRTGTARC